MERYVLLMVNLIGINVILAIGLHIITGLTGQFSLGHASFAAIGAYTAALLSLNAEVPFFVGLPAGGLAAALIGWVVAFSSTRFKGDYLALVTLGFGEIVRVVLLNLQITNGAYGLTRIPQETTILVIGIIVVLGILISLALERSYAGRAMWAVRDDEEAAEALGVHLSYYKQLAFVLGTFLAGLAGGLYAHYLTYINPQDFGMSRSVEILLYVIIGGMGQLWGAILGAAVLTLLPEFLRGFSDYRMIVYGAILVLIMIYRPEGLLGTRGSTGFNFGRLIRRAGPKAAASEKKTAVPKEAAGETKAAEGGTSGL